jgi:hypothetical protein
MLLLFNRIGIDWFGRLVPLSNRLLPSNRVAFVVVETIRRDFVLLTEGVRDLPCTWALVRGMLPCSGEV